jgi:hypothetical protein
MEKQGPLEANQPEQQNTGNGRVPEQDPQRQHISHLDQQEGHMNNGQLGGNFDETRPEDNREKQ